MAEEKTGEKPNIGLEKPPTSEVEGHASKMLIYTCLSCGAGNYVDPKWMNFTCWRCGIYALHEAEF